MVDGRLSGVCSEENGYKIVDNQLFYDATKSLMKHLNSKKINYAFSLCTNRNIPNRYIHFFFDQEALMLSLYDKRGECVILPIDSAVKNHNTEIKQKFLEYW